MTDFFGRIVKTRDKILIVKNDNYGTRLECRYVIGEDNKFGGTLYTIREYYLPEIDKYVESFNKKQNLSTDNIRTSQFIIIESIDFKSNHL